MRLNQLPVVDLYLGVDYCDIKDMPGSTAPSSAAPVALQEELAEVRGKCEAALSEGDDPEFALEHEGVLYRVTTFVDTARKPVFVLSRASNKIIPLAKLDVHRRVKDACLAPSTRGIILVSGEMGSGKTTTATTLFVERIKTGVIGLALEDPIESQLNGKWGNGRCIQVQVSRKRGGYREELIRGMRSRAETIYLGEIRDEATAEQAVQLSNMGHLVITTVHGGSLQQALDRTISWASGLRDPAAMLADGLAVVLHQKLVRENGPPKLVVQSLTLAGGERDDGARQFAQSVRALIKAGDTNMLKSHIDQQAQASAWRQA